MKNKWYIAVTIVISMIMLVGCNNSKVEDSPREEPEVEKAPLDYPFYEIIDRRGYSLENDLNIRDQSGMEGKILTTIQKGDGVHVLGLQEGWYRVRYGEDQEGWIYGKYIQLEDLESQGEVQQTEPIPQEKQEVQSPKSKPKEETPKKTPEKEKDHVPEWSNKERSWYFSRRSDHQQPALEVPIVAWWYNTME